MDDPKNEFQHSESCRPVHELTREMKENQAALAFNEGMAKLNRIVDKNRQAQNQQYNSHNQANASASFDDDAYLAILFERDNQHVKKPL